jgi:hypothetical protein
MTLAAPAPSLTLERSGRFTGLGRRLQGAFVLLCLVAAVAGTVVLVAPRPASPAAGGSPGSSAPASASSWPSPSSAVVAGLPAGLRVAVEGGDPFVAYGLADRLVGAGASLGAVAPSPSKDAVAPATTIVYYDAESRSAAARIRAMLGGRGTLRRQRVFQPPVDVTIVLGKDLARL